MRTLGIDLASQPENTALCLINWQVDRATVTELQLGVSDEDILNQVAELKRNKVENHADFAIGIDAPFGWPLPFVEFLTRLASGQPVPVPEKVDVEALKFRLTDVRVIEDVGLVPLSVAADKIAIPAMRCAGLLDSLDVHDRSGVDGVFEVYPAAALKAWGLRHKGFKPGGANPKLAKEKLAELFEELCKQCPWLRFLNGTATTYKENDHAFDALIAALAARAAALGRTSRPRNEEEQAHARVEGWIAFPCENCAIGDLLG